VNAARAVNAQRGEVFSRAITLVPVETVFRILLVQRNHYGIARGFRKY
jgi:hypothetical protein